MPLEKFEKLVVVLLSRVFSLDSDRDLAAAIHCWLFSHALVEALFVIAKKMRSQCSIMQPVYAPDSGSSHTMLSLLYSMTSCD